MSEDFSTRLSKALPQIAEHFGTPFHIYDEKGIRETADLLYDTFKDVPNFREYYAVKALPNLSILKIMNDVGFGFDCSSITELVLSRRAGGSGTDIMFTSNNTSPDDFNMAHQDGGCILNLDDITLLDKVPDMPELLSFRYNPGDRRTVSNGIIGEPLEAKYGVSHEQLIEAYKKAKDMGVKEFGLHAMLASNELNYKFMVETTQMLLDLVALLKEKAGVTIKFINIGGGLGIPYKPEDSPLDIKKMGEEITAIYDELKAKGVETPDFIMESGRFVTGPHGVLVTKAINFKKIYRTYVGVDATMADLMRPGMYGAYHHVTVNGKEHLTHDQKIDVVGSLCENNDKFAVERMLPEIEDGDLIVVHDTGAHGHAMGFNYNGKLRSKELLLKEDGTVELIRRQETPEDYFATLEFEENILQP
jgi:diaminopimelate decarboxylase